MDTSFLIDFLRGRPEASKHLARLSVTSEAITIPAPAIFELVENATLNSSRKEERALQDFLSSVTVLPLDTASAWKAGEINAALTLAGEQIGQMDSLIAGIALTHDQVLVTRDINHFSRIPGLEVENYFAE